MELYVNREANTINVTTTMNHDNYNEKEEKLKTEIKELK